MEDSRSAATWTRGRKSRTAIYAQVEEGVTALKDKWGGLPTSVEAGGIWGDIWTQEAHNSTALEGNTLVIQEVEVLLREGKAVGTKQLSEYLEVQGYGNAAGWVYNQALGAEGWTSEHLLTVTEVRQVHHLALSPVWEVAPHEGATEAESPGNFRRHNIHPFSRGMVPPSFTDVPHLMSSWVEEVNGLKESSSALFEGIATAHASFEQIHPFLDGNGRVGRLLTNLVLVRLGYPPAVIRKRERARYLKALHKGDEGDPGPLGELLARAVLDTLYDFVIPAVAGPARLVPLKSLEEPKLQVRALLGAIERGRLRAQRDERGQWWSTSQWVEEYKASRDRRGRPPKLGSKSRFSTRVKS